MISIAIDGPAGAGKSSLARAAAKKLGFLYADTGALYRTVGLKFLRCGADALLACDVEDILSRTSVDLRFVGDEQHVFLDGTDVTGEIRTPEVSVMASKVSAKPQVRAYLLEMQRRLAREHDVLMDGRDIGTVVLPQAQVKIFLTASAEERAKRRYLELTEKGQTVDYETVYREMVQRDLDDSTRTISPLKPAADSVTVDTSDCDLEQSLELLLSVIWERLGKQ